MRDKRFWLRLSVLAIIMVALFGALFSAFTEDDGVIRASDEAPDFRLSNLHDQTVTLSELKGKGVMLNFWATWCEPCRKEMPDMQRQYEIYKDQGIEIVAVNIAESNLAAQRFAERYELHFPIVMDRDRTVTRQYNVGQLPSSFFIDENGVVVEHVVGMMSADQIRDRLESIKPGS